MAAAPTFARIVRDKRQVTGDKILYKTGYKKLIAWEIADKLAWSVYKLSDKFPLDELFGLTSQLRYAVLSVPLKIVKGHARNNQNEFRRFLKIAFG